jgi:sigma-E factor negative regulatory protein RseC
MIETQAWVVATEGDFVWVEAAQGSTCEGCHVSGGCGTSVLGQLFGRRPYRLRAANPVGADIGDRVAIGLDEGAFLRGAVLVYALPVLGLVLGGLAAVSLMGGGDTSAVVGGGLGLVLGLSWSRIRSQSLARDHRYQPIVLRRILPSISTTVLR